MKDLKNVTALNLVARSTAEWSLRQVLIHIAVIVVAIFCLIQIAPLYARADLIVEPWGDSFFDYMKDNNPDSLGRIDRSLVCPNDMETITFYSDPRKSSQLSIKAKETYISVCCNFNNQYWGYSETENAWAIVDGLHIKYDYISFSEEYSHEFDEYIGDSSFLDGKESIVIWTYPGSGEVRGNIKLYPKDIEDFHKSIYTIYTDSSGRQWGYISYWYGQKNSWFCIDDVSSTSIEPFFGTKASYPWAPDAELKSAITEIEEDILYGTPPPVQDRSWIVVAALIFVVAAGTVVIITILFRSKKGKTRQG